MAREAGWGGPHWGARDRGEPRLAGLGFPLRGGPGTFGVLWDLAKSPSQQGRCRESPATPSAGTRQRSLPARWLLALRAPFFSPLEFKIVGLWVKVQGLSVYSNGGRGQLRVYERYALMLLLLLLF